MYQALFYRFADAVFPILCGILVWFGIHYFVLTPRIIKVEMPEDPSGSGTFYSKLGAAYCFSRDTCT